MSRLLSDLATRTLRADVTEVLPLTEARTAHERMESGENVSRLVLEVKRP